MKKHTAKCVDVSTGGPSDGSITVATPAEIDEVLDWTHATWGGSLSLAAYRARVAMLMQTAWGREHYRFWVRRTPDGQLAAACKAYRLAMFLDRSPIEVLGFGAVFTHPNHRGHGYAATLLDAVMHHADTAGCELALLFTDIDPAYYERLGFEGLPTSRGSASALAGGSAFRPIESPAARDLALWRGEIGPGLTCGRQSAYWEYLLAREEAEVCLYHPDGLEAPARGYVAVTSSNGRLAISEAGYAADVEPQAFWESLRVFAGTRGESEVVGWLPVAAEAGGFTREPLLKGLPMIARLPTAPNRKALPPIARAAFWSIDHF